MQIINTPKSMQKIAESLRGKRKTIGLVPTMGALHEGHLSLIKRSAMENDITVVSIFVNPTQFGPNEDFARYPRAFKKDRLLAQKAGADFIFHPTASAMYPDNFQTFVIPDKIADKLEGAARPGHFKGVATICLKLFNIVKPHRAYFGQKDAQQLAVIRQMARDFNLDLKIVGCPIVRTRTGVALSSRHVYLSESELRKATVIHKALLAARKEINAGQRSISKLRKLMAEIIGSESGLFIEYISFNRWDNLEELRTLSGNTLISLVVRIGKVRLLDNTLIRIR
jgi:pantoate--beta-alanine ligase